MRRHASPLLRLLGLVLLVQTLLAPLACIAGARAETLRMEICGPEGMRSIDMPLDEAPAHHGAHGFCALCHALPAAPLLLTPLLPMPAWLAAEHGWFGTPPATSTAQARAPPQQPRAPPSV
jgi:hypothetical protein